MDLFTHRKFGIQYTQAMMEVSRSVWGPLWGVTAKTYGNGLNDWNTLTLDNEFVVGGRVGCGLAAVWWGTFDHGRGHAGRPLPRPVVPGRNGLALQLAPQLRSNPGPLHPARPARLRRRAERLWVCGRESIAVCGQGWAAGCYPGAAACVAVPDSAGSLLQRLSRQVPSAT